MQRETPGNSQSKLLDQILFSLPHKPISKMSDMNLFDDEPSDEYEETPMEEDEMSEDLSCSSDEEEEEEDDNNVVEVTEDENDEIPETPEPEANSPVTLSGTMHKKKLFSRTSSKKAAMVPESDDDFDDDEDDVQKVLKPSPKPRKTQTLAQKIRKDKQPLIELGKKNSSPSVSILKKKQSSLGRKKNANMPIDFQTIKTVKMENGTYRGKEAHVIKRGNVSKSHLLISTRRKTTSEKPKSITDQIKALVERKVLHFRDLSYVYIQSPEDDKPGIL